MPASFFFYDLETTGISPAKDRIMQFAGQRTDLSLNKVEKPINQNIRLSPDILPEPQAILLSGISPMSKDKNSLNEAEFSKIFNKDIATSGTIFVGFNNIRFDDEFIRYLNYRNFYDAYTWHWQNKNSRWDMLDVLRMSRALRPEGLNWPFNDDKPSNRLEHLTAANKLEHMNAHDALSDALATLELAKLLKRQQPKLFSFLLSMRAKANVIELLKSNEMVVYTSSHYSSSVLHTTVVSVLALDEAKSSSLVYDLRLPAEEFLNLSVEELTRAWEYNPERNRPSLPVKTMKLNRCPAVAPISVLDKAAIKRLQLDMKAILSNQKIIAKNKEEFVNKLNKITKNLDKQRDQRRAGLARIPFVDERLYDKFIPKSDNAKFIEARDKARLAKAYEMDFSDKRLVELYRLYRARNYPKLLTKTEAADYSQFIFNKLFSGDDSNYQRIKAEINTLKTTKLSAKKQRLLKELEEYINVILDDYGKD